MNKIRVHVVDWQKDNAELCRIREAVFITEQSVPPEPERNVEDDKAVHFLAYEGEYAIGTARLLGDGRIGRVSVLKDQRDLKVDDALMCAVIEEAERHDLKCQLLTVQAYAIPFYERLGFKVDSGGFLDAGLSHVDMVRDSDRSPMSDTPEISSTGLPVIEFSSPRHFAVRNPASAALPAERWEPAPFRSDEHESLERFEHPQEARAHVLALLQQARRPFCLHSPDLESWFYHHSGIQEACTRFLLANPRNRLRIPVGDSVQAMCNGHRLISLSCRLPSNCLIRRLNPDYSKEGDAFLLADDQDLLLCPKPV